MSRNVLNLVGGISNTPLTNTDDNFIIQSSKDIRIVFDWCSITFENFDIKKHNKMFYLDSESKNILDDFLSKIGFSNGIDFYKKISPKNGFQVGYQLDENIFLYYGSDNIKSSNGTYLCQLLMTGKGCREFETYHKGSWKILFSEIKKMRSYNFPRIDIAVDDFKGLYSIYKIESKLRNQEAITPFRSKQYLINEYGNSTNGFTIELGKRGSNQLVIYDKNLERKAKDLEDENTTYWYRYEMRFTDDKAKEMIDQFLLSIDNPDFNFGVFASEILYSYLDIKISDGTINKSRWPTDPEWLNFLGVVQKNRLTLDEKIPSTIEKKRKWYENLETTNAELFLTTDNFIEFIFSNIISGLKKMKDINKYRVKNYFKNLGIDFSDVKIEEIMSKLQKSKYSLIDLESGEIIGGFDERN